MFTDVIQFIFIGEVNERFLDFYSMTYYGECLLSSHCNHAKNGEHMIGEQILCHCVDSAS